MEEEGTIKNRDKSICIKLYLKPKAFAEVVGEAERAGIRRKGLLLYTQKKNGMRDEKLANTDRIAKFYKFCAKYYVDHEQDRLNEAAKAAAALKAAKEWAEKVGLQP